MTTPKLSFQEITIHRMPGFPTGGLSLEALSPGVNIIYGPNASGKSTLCRAMQRILRAQDTPHNHDSLFATLDYRASQLTVRYDMGQVTSQLDGADVAYPALAPAEMKDRYVLALQDLIHAEEKGEPAEDCQDMASFIRSELAGGYNVAEAAKLLDFRSRPSSRPKAKKELEQAREARRNIENEHKKLAADEARLGSLGKQRDEAFQAQQRLQWLDKALNLKSAEENLYQAQENLKQFPQGVGRLRGDELERLAKIQDLQEQAESNRVVESDHRDTALQKRSACDLPDGGLPSEQIGTLRGQLVSLQSLASDLKTAEKAVQKSRAKSRQARELIGTALPDSESDPLDLATLKQLTPFARRAEKLRADSQAAEALSDWLDTAGQKSPESDPEQLSQAARLLDRWLAASEESTAAGPPRKWLLVAAGAVGLVAIILAALLHGLWLLLLSAAVVLVAWAVTSQPTSDSRSLVQRELERLDCGVPAGWTAEQVKPFARDLQKQVAAARLSTEQSVKWGSLQQQRDQLARQQVELDEEKAEWTERLGIDPRHAQADEAWLYLLAENLNRLHQAEEELQAAEAQRDHAAGQFKTLLEEINTTLQSFGLAPTGSTEAATATVETLSERGRLFDESQSAIAAAEKELARLDQEIERLDEEKIELFAHVGLKVSQEDELKRWTDDFPKYQGADEAVRNAQRDHNTAQGLLSEHSELAERTRDSLYTERDQCQQQAQQIERISEEITEIETLLREKKKGTDLEAAIAHQENCTEALRELRDQDAQAMVGSLLAQYLQRQQQDREDCEVFKRAKELFVRITHGRYRLDIQEGDPTSFRAFDTSRDVGLSLAQLSSGTRLQLLLAVRVAFVERQETDLKLPLILDETLGNSDEGRAIQIIEAAIEVCREGRQVFYMTAQHDEVGKWNSVLEDHDDISHRLFDLAELRNFSETERVGPMLYERPEVTQVPAPEHDDWHAYGTRLGVPRFNPYDDIGGLHLWYMIDEVEVLYPLLERSINKWGQFQTLAGHGHNGFLSEDAGVFESAQAAARVLKAASKHWRTGRGMPVDRKVLIDSDAVTPTYIDAVCDLAVEVEGNAQELIDALEAKRVRGFQKKKLSELQEYLQEHGYLDPQEILCPAEIRERVLIEEYNCLDQGLLSRERFEQLIAIVVQGVAVTAENISG